MSLSAPFLVEPATVRLTDLVDLLDRIPRVGSPEIVEENLTLVEKIGDPVLLSRILRSVVADPVLLATIAGRSYRHVNHFDKIVLVDSGDRQGYRLTLHLWNPPYTSDEFDDELVHDHRFSFWSNILVGSLRSQNFVRSQEGRQYRQYRYVPEKRAETTTANFYEFVGATGLVETEPSLEVAGSSYHLYYRRIHRVVLPQTSMTCTLVLRGPRERNHSNVYNTVYPSTDTRATNVMFTEAEVAEKLLGIVGEMDRTRARRR